MEVERSLRVLDSAIAVFDGVGGVETQSETVWRQADHYHIPRICFVNKMDRIGADFERCLDMIQDKLLATPLPLQIPIGSEHSFKGVIDLISMTALYWQGEKGEEIVEAPIPEDLKDQAAIYRNNLIEKLAENDDDIMVKYLDGIEPDLDDIIKALRQVTVSLKLFPAFCGSALKNTGIQPILNAIVNYLPSPKDVKPVQGHNPDNHDNVISRIADDKEPFCGLVFKLMSDPHVGKLSFLRVYSGHVRIGDVISNATAGKKEKVTRFLRMHADKREEVTEVYTGDIVAVVGLKHAKTGDTFTDEKSPILLEKMTFPDPVMSIAIEPKTNAEQDKLSHSLAMLADEDPTFQIHFDEETGQTIISGMGELHLEIIIDRLLREFHIKANVGKPQITYKETISQSAKVDHVFEKNIAGKDHLAHVIIEVEPAKPGSGFIFNNLIKNDAIPQQYIAEIESSLKDAMQTGVIAGYLMDNIRVSLVGGSYDEHKSSDIAYKISANMAFKDAVRKASPTLMEPLMKLEVVTPDEYTGDIINDINSRRGKIDSISMLARFKVVKSLVPLDELFGYAAGVRSLSQGKASYSMQFSHYENMPHEIAEKIMMRISGAIFH